MAPVIGTIFLSGTEPKYRFRSNFFNKQILQIGYECKDWDTNTGHDEGPIYTSWSDATRQEAEELICRVKK